MKILPSVVFFLLSPTGDRASVLREPSVVLTKRSQRVRQPGDLCCPGGGIASRLDNVLGRFLKFAGDAAHPMVPHGNACAGGTPRRQSDWPPSWRRVCEKDWRRCGSIRWAFDSWACCRPRNSSCSNGSSCPWSAGCLVSSVFCPTGRLNGGIDSHPASLGPHPLCLLPADLPTSPGRRTRKSDHGFSLLCPLGRPAEGNSLGRDLPNHHDVFNQGLRFFATACRRPSGDPKPPLPQLHAGKRLKWKAEGFIGLEENQARSGSEWVTMVIETVENP